jgi:ADP-ribosylglycohydrolase
MTDMMDHPVTAHGGDHVETIRHRGGSQLTGVIGRLGPGRLHLILPPKNAEHGAVVSPRELRGGGIGDQQEPTQEGKATGLASNLVIEQSSADSTTPLFSLLNGEGAGAMLAAAAGDVAGGASSMGYSALTQQSTVLAYHVLRHDSVDRPQLGQDWLELGSDGDSPTVYRSPSEEFESFLRAIREGEAAASAEPSVEPAARIHPVGVWFRRDSERLVEAAMATARLTHVDAATVLGAVTVAGAVAASCFAQSGRDLLSASAEVARRCLAAIDKEAFLYSRVDDARAWADLLTESIDWVGKPPQELVSGVDQFGPSGPPAYRALLAILIVAPFGGEPYRQVEQAASLGGSGLASIVGAMAGARAGLRLWPWVVPNDTWFAEIGRRLVNGNQETRDLPVPYDVEERLTFGGPGDLI